MAFVRLDLSSRVAVVTLSHPGGNRINFEMRGKLLDAFEQVAASEARLGIMTLQGGMLQLAERVGRSKAIELVFLSEPATAEQMALWNVVNRVVEDGELDKEVGLLAQRLAAGPPGAYAATKAIMRKWSLDGARSEGRALRRLHAALRH